jgi:hypothetical protein
MKKDCYPVILMPKIVKDYLRSQPSQTVNWVKPQPPRRWTQVLRPRWGWASLVLIVSLWLLGKASQSGTVLTLGLLALASSGVAVGIEQLAAWSEEQYQIRWQDYLHQLRQWNNAQALIKRASLRKQRQRLDERREQLKMLLENKVLQPVKQSSARQGVSERGFFRCLKRYFGSWVEIGGEFPIPGRLFSYSLDISLIEPITGLRLAVEIDEPYEGKNCQPIHCQDNPHERQRNRFFLQNNWIVIRFAEEQVVRYPHRCVLTIARVLTEVLGDEKYVERLKGLESVPPVRRWTKKQAIRMARRGIRKRYLAQKEIVVPVPKKRSLLLL